MAESTIKKNSALENSVFYIEKSDIDACLRETQGYLSGDNISKIAGLITNTIGESNKTGLYIKCNKNIGGFIGYSHDGYIDGYITGDGTTFTPLAIRNADHATTADSATTATSATSAANATNADHATSADSATTVSSVIGLSKGGTGINASSSADLLSQLGAMASTMTTFAGTDRVNGLRVAFNNTTVGSSRLVYINQSLASNMYGLSIKITASVGIFIGITADGKFVGTITLDGGTSFTKVNAFES